ncbi:MAG: nucleotidyltransferase domain-containing protein [Sedimentisphaerales bacterium]|jgi:predicted nucleotidyltransferase|nr:nucleotidyltransferase domain-containing protein [Sedimentisphaerales bacterium]
MISQKVLQKAANRLAEQFDPQRIILFGSYARSMADEHSDVDLLVICPFQGKRRKLMVVMDRALRGLNFARDIVILTPEEFERDIQIPGTLARTVRHEGKILYEKA